MLSPKLQEAIYDVIGKERFRKAFLNKEEIWGLRRYEGKGALLRGTTCHTGFIASLLRGQCWQEILLYSGNVIQHLAYIIFLSERWICEPVHPVGVYCYVWNDLLIW
jgi:hypothetical protein